MPTSHGTNDAPTTTTPAGPLRQWRVLLATAAGAAELRTTITARTAAEVLDYLERTVTDETLLGIIDVTPSRQRRSRARVETATTPPGSSNHRVGTL